MEKMGRRLQFLEDDAINRERYIAGRDQYLKFYDQVKNIDITPDIAEQINMANFRMAHAYSAYAYMHQFPSWAAKYAPNREALEQEYNQIRKMMTELSTAIGSPFFLYKKYVREEPMVRLKPQKRKSYYIKRKRS